MIRKVFKMAYTIVVALMEAQLMKMMVFTTIEQNIGG